MTGNATGKGELQGELAQPRLIATDIRIHLAVRAFQIGVCHDSRATMTRAGDVQHAQIEFDDCAIQMHVDEVLPGCGAPVAKQHVFHI